MRFVRPATLISLLAAGLLTGCGGNQIAADEVPVDPPVLTVPADADAAPGKAADADATATPGADATATPDSSGTSSGTTGATAPSASGGTGGTASGGAAATPAPTQAPAETGGAGATDEGLDQFCADNPGAC
jgi:hypothetical protein